MRQLILIVLIIGFSIANAAPSPFSFDKKVKPHASEKYVRAVHEELPTNNASIETIRYRIVEGMLKTRGRVWTYEGEGDNFILARFDYRGNTTVMRIEYDEQLVQLKYHDAIGDFVCKNLRSNGICYENARGYYNYTKNLRTSILLQMQAI